MERLEATIRGSVQGVGFRWFITRHAARLGLCGWVANVVDGSVRVVAEGDAGSLDQLAGLLDLGPAGARVDAVQTRRGPGTGEFSRFETRSGSHPGD